MKILIVALLTLTLSVYSFELSPEEKKEIEASLRHIREYAHDASSRPPDEAYSKLGLALVQTSKPATYPHPERQEVHTEIREALLTLPGYGEFIRSRLEKARDLLDASQGVSESGPRAVDLEGEQSMGFQILGLLPSAESVGTLGEFLYDERGRVAPSPAGSPDDRSKRQGKTGLSPNSMYALRAIAKLPIVSPPVQRRKNNFVIYDDDINSWRLWYEQVKAGTRTFQFEGDPTEYTLAGPVQADASSTAVTSRAKATPPEEASKGDGPARRLFWPILASALALLAAGAWAAIARGKHAR